MAPNQSVATALPLRIVVDTNVIVSGFRSRRGASFDLLSILPSEHVSLLISPALLVEYEMVLKRERLDTHSFDEIEEILDLICLIGERQDIWYSWRPFGADPADDFIVDLAANARADFIVTYNDKHFKDMGRFGVHVCTPKQFLDFLHERTHNSDSGFHIH